MKSYLMTIRSGIDKGYAEALNIMTQDGSLVFLAENDEKANEYRIRYFEQMETINRTLVSDLIVLDYKNAAERSTVMKKERR